MVQNAEQSRKMRALKSLRDLATWKLMVTLAENSFSKAREIEAKFQWVENWMEDEVMETVHKD